MPEENPSWAERLSLAARYLIVAALAMILSLLLFGAKNDHALASSPVGAVPSMISFTAKVGTDSKFYVTDTARKIICVYSLSGDKLRLVSARKYDIDQQILDSSLPVGITIEGGNGATREKAAEFLKASKPALDQQAKKFKQNHIGGQSVE
jgi:hypothetical protein